MFKDLVMKNRSYRGYDRSRKVTEEELKALVDLSRYTPSTVNRQPAKYYITCDEKEVADIQAMTKWGGALPELHLPYPGTEPVAFIVVCMDKVLSENAPMYLRDIGIVSQTILLGAVEMGLGGCMIGSFNKQKLNEYLELPRNVEANLVIALGKPAEDIVITEAVKGKTTYYRDEDGKTHYVPKRPLDEIILKRPPKEEEEK